MEIDTEMDDVNPHQTIVLASQLLDANEPREASYHAVCSLSILYQKIWSKPILLVKMIKRMEAQGLDDDDECDHSCSERCLRGNVRRGTSVRHRLQGTSLLYGILHIIISLHDSKCRAKLFHKQG